MQNLAQLIERDRKYAEEVGFDVADASSKDDEAFAKDVIGPLGAHLKVVHEVRRYNAIEFVADRQSVDNLRANIHINYRAKPPLGLKETSRGSQQSVLNSFNTIIATVCDVEESLDLVESINPKVKTSDKLCQDREQVIKRYVQGRLFNPELPYGTMLAALFLNASGEVDSALKEIDRWAREYAPSEDKDLFRLFPRHRALFYAAEIARGDPDARRSRRPAVLQYRTVLALGDQLLLRPAWRKPIKNLEKSFGVDPMWLSDACSHSLPELFRRFIGGQINSINNFVYLLSQDLPFAKHEGLLDEMEKRADYLAKVNVSCLRLSDQPDEIERVRRLQGTFLDTVAAVQYALASEEERASEKRTRLCSARRQAERALRIAQELAGDRQRALTLQAGAKPWEYSEWWRRARLRDEAVSSITTFTERLDQIKTTITAAGVNCTI